MMWYQAGKVTRKIRQRANVPPSWVAANLGLKSKQYKQVERGEMRLDSELLAKWCQLVALGRTVHDRKGEIQLTPEQQVNALGYMEAVRRAQAQDKARRRARVK